MSIETYGSYQLLKRLATGGMAQIFLARQTGLEGFEKLLVVKRILPHLAENEEFITMFLDEARIAARLNHPNIVQIFNLGAQDDSYFIAMEYIHGEDVRRVWKRAEAEGRSVPAALVCRVIMDACAGLDYAHKKTDEDGRPLGIVHRDISPQNILVTFQGGVKVVDFGIAKAVDKATITRSGVLKGKYSYMSPEQAAGREVDSRTDIFALGVVLYELLTGTRLFKRANDVQTLNAVAECRVTPPSQVNPSLPASVDPIVLKALAKRPDDRYQEAVELQVALEGWLLEQQLPSSSAHLAAFMRELYSERLAREQAEGRFLVEDLDGSREEPPPRRDRATPASRSGRRPTASAPQLHEEATAAERPDRVGGRSPSRRAVKRLDDPSVDTAATLSRTGRRRLVVASVAAAITAIIIAGVLYVRGRKAVVWLSSEPPGATVVFNGQPLAELTPCALPPTAPGTYSLTVGKAGFLDQRLTVPIPASGEVQLPVVRLQAERPAPAEPERGVLRIAGTHEADVAVDGEALGPTPLEIPVLAGKRAVRLTASDGGTTECEVEIEPRGLAALVFSGEGCAAASADKVLLTVRSDPPGGQLSMGGVALGHTPLTVEVEPRRPVDLKIELTGHLAAERRVEIGPGAPQELSIPLERRRPEPKHGGSTAKREPKDREPRAMGTVRFVVTPWAEVACGSYALGQTPFKDKQLPAGDYDCKFTNPELGTKIEKVTVRANETSRVTVKF